jgi:uncharacterized protein (DUF433 family)
MQHSTLRLTREMSGDTVYEYYPIGHYVVSAPDVGGGRPTFKYTRLEVAVVLDLLASGWTVECLVEEYTQSQLTPEAVGEAVRLAKEALLTTMTPTQHPS